MGLAQIISLQIIQYLTNQWVVGTPTFDLMQLTQGWNTSATWNKYDGTNAWTTAGGDFDATVAASNTVSKTIGWFKWFPRQLVQGWIDGSIANNGVVVKEATERSNNATSGFNTTLDINPRLPRLGPVGQSSTTRH